MDLIAGVDLHLSRSVVVTPSYGCFWRVSLKDGLYGFAGNLLRPAGTSTSRRIGQQLELDVVYQVAPSTTLRAVGEYFLAGPFLNGSPPSKNVTYGTLWLDYHF